MRVCEVCGKKSLIQESGAHQYGGGWAMRATKKRFEKLVNFHSAKVTYRGVRKTMRLCTKCLRRVKASDPEGTLARRGEMENALVKKQVVGKSAELTQLSVAAV